MTVSKKNFLNSPFKKVNDIDFVENHDQGSQSHYYTAQEKPATSSRISNSILNSTPTETATNQQHFDGLNFIEDEPMEA